MNFGLYAIAWGVIATVTAVLMIYKRVLGEKEDDSVHMMDYEAKIVEEQVSMANRITAIERWTTVLIVLTLVSGAVLAGLYLHQSWMESSTIK